MKPAYFSPARTATALAVASGTVGQKEHRGRYPEGNGAPPTPGAAGPHAPQMAHRPKRPEDLHTQISPGPRRPQRRPHHHRRTAGRTHHRVTGMNQPVRRAYWWISENVATGPKYGGWSPLTEVRRLAARARGPHKSRQSTRSAQKSLRAEVDVKIAPARRRCKNRARLQSM